MQDRVLFTTMQTQSALIDRLSGRKPDGAEAISSILSGLGNEHGDDAGLRLQGAKGAATREAFRAEVYAIVLDAIAWESIRVATSAHGLKRDRS